MGRKSKNQILLEAAAANGDAQANYELGLFFKEKVKFEKAAECFKIGAEQGHDGCRYSLGVAYRFGKGVPQNIPQAAKLFQAAAQTYGAGYYYSVLNIKSDSCFALAQLYHMGLGIEQSYEKALLYYEKAVSSDFEHNVDPKISSHPGACYQLGELYSDETLGDVQYQRAARYYIKAEYGGIASATSKISALYNKVSQQLDVHTKNHCADLSSDELWDLNRASTILLHHLQQKALNHTPE